MTEKYKIVGFGKLDSFYYNPQNARLIIGKVGRLQEGSFTDEGFFNGLFILDEPAFENDNCVYPFVEVTLEKVREEKKMEKDACAKSESIILYAPIYERFEEETLDGEIIYSGSFSIIKDPIVAKVIRQSVATVVIFDDGSKGVAKCSKDEKYSSRKGLKIAFYRALIQRLQKEIDKLSWE